MEQIYAVCRHFQDNDSEGYMNWLGKQILSYHKTKTGAAKELMILLTKEINVSETSHDSEERKEHVRNNQVLICDGAGMNITYELEELYYIDVLDLKP